MGADEPARRDQAGPGPHLSGGRNRGDDQSLSAGGTRPAGRTGIARVLVDVAALTQPFDYSVPPSLADQVRIGTLVRVDLQGRRVGGWVVDLVDVASTTRPLKPIRKVTGWGPGPELVTLAAWAAWRWAGRTSSLLRAASPQGAVRFIPPRPGPRPVVAGGSRPVAPLEGSGTRELAAAAFAEARRSVGARGWRPVVVRLPPASDPWDFVLAAAGHPDALVLCPTHQGAAELSARLVSAALSTAVLPAQWALAAAGSTVAIGARGAAWSPRPELGAVLVLDEHDEGYQEERNPTWNARDVAVERARRAGVPCVLVSPCPSLEALSAGPLLVASRNEERSGWPAMEIIDRRNEPPGLGLYSPRLVELARSARRFVAVLNRKGRVRLLACHGCGALARCESCGATVGEAAPVEGGRAAAEAAAPDGAIGSRARLTGDPAPLVCGRCGQRRPRVCANCGATRMRALRIGVSRAREDLERLSGRAVVEVTAERAASPARPSAGAIRCVPEREPTGEPGVVVGTSAVLHRVRSADVVAFLDMDQELLAPRYRAAEEALGLLARAATIVGGRGGGRVVVQTRMADHETLDAALHADPGRLAVVEGARRAALRFPPEAALAALSGDGAAELAGWIASFGPASTSAAISEASPSDSGV
ncbi:MAG: primosomal protein N' family DNA-binding protein, partial [Acidimicrobiales bacterium]